MIILFYQDLFGTWNNQVNDQIFRIRYQLLGKKDVSPYLIHVVLNDTGYQELGLSIWDRTVFGQIIGILQETNVELIACDIFFKDKSVSANDSFLIEATKKSGKVIFPVLVYPEDYRTFLNAKLAEDEFEEIIKLGFKEIFIFVF